MSLFRYKPSWSPPPDASVSMSGPRFQSVGPLAPMPETGVPIEPTLVCYSVVSRRGMYLPLSGHPSALPGVSSVISGRSVG